MAITSTAEFDGMTQLAAKILPLPSKTKQSESFA